MSGVNVIVCSPAVDAGATDSPFSQGYGVADVCVWNELSGDDFSSAYPTDDSPSHDDAPSTDDARSDDMGTIEPDVTVGDASSQGNS